MASDAAEAAPEAARAQAQLQRRLSQLLHGSARSISDGGAVKAEPWQPPQGQAGPQGQPGAGQQMPWRLTDSSTGSKDTAAARGRLSMTQMLSADCLQARRMRRGQEAVHAKQQELAMLETMDCTKCSSRARLQGCSCHGISRAALRCC